MAASVPDRGASWALDMVRPRVRTGRNPHLGRCAARVNARRTCTGGEYDTPVQYMPVVTILSSRDRFVPLASAGADWSGAGGVGILPT